MIRRLYSNLKPETRAGNGTAAWKKFSFENVRPMWVLSSTSSRNHVDCCRYSRLEEVLKHGTGLKMRLDLINSLPVHASEGERDILRDWCSNQTSSALSSLKNPKKEDVPILMTVVRSKGLSFLSDK